MKLTLQSLLAFVPLVFSPMMGFAQTVQLTGGDSTDGLALSGTLISAIYTKGASTTPITLQGYAFQPYTINGSAVGGLSVSGALFFPGLTPNTAANAGFTSPGNSANDQALLNLANSGTFADYNTLTVTATGLTSGQSYTLNFITSVLGYAGSAKENLSINGGTPQLISLATGTGIFDTQVTATAGSNGNITAVFTQVASAPVDPFVNAVLITKPVQSVANTPTIYGINTHEIIDFQGGFYTQPNLVSLLTQTGVTSIRDDITWATCETTQGVIVIPPTFITYINNAVAAGLSPIIVFDYSNPFYDGGGYPQSATAMQAFAKYCMAIVTQFKGKVKYYQVWNEWENGTGMNGLPGGTTQGYVNLLSVVYPQIKAIDPTITVLGNAIASGDATLQTAIADGETRYCDGVDLHPYDYTYPDPYSDIELWYNRMKNENYLISGANGGQPFPLYITEMGWPTQIGSMGCTQEEEAQYLARYFILGATLPSIKGLWWYDFRDNGWTYDWNEDNYGLVRCDFTPKLAWSALQDVMALLKGATYTDQINVNDPNVFLMRFKEANGNYFIAAWSEWKDTDWTILLNQPASANPNVNLTAIGHGTQQTSFTTTAVNSVPTLSVTLRRNPVIIEGDLQNATCWQITKTPFPETTRPVITAPAVPVNGTGSNGGP